MATKCVLSREMMSCLRRVMRHSTRQMSAGAATVSGAKPTSDGKLDIETLGRVAPRIGNRDIVGYGYNGVATYYDNTDFPCPAIRFGENSAAFDALREKEKGDWNKLSLEDKKALYRSNFCLTYAEIDAPTTQGKEVFTIVFAVLCLGSIFNIIMKQFFYSRYPWPSTATPEYQEQMMYRMVDQRQGKIYGVASHWDYENKKWKE